MEQDWAQRHAHLLNIGGGPNAKFVAEGAACQAPSEGNEEAGIVSREAGVVTADFSRIIRRHLNERENVPESVASNSPPA